MKSSRKGVVCAGLLAAAAGLTGCGGLSGSQGVSPAMFLGVTNRPPAFIPHTLARAPHSANPVSHANPVAPIAAASSNEF
jgi:hypothetical protein